MGAKGSKPSFITYEEAVKRVSESELKRIGEAFKKSAGSAGVPLSKNGFIQDVLGDGVPRIVSDWLFAACGGTRRGIAFKDLLCGLVVLTKGTQEERIKFLWTLYCNEAGTHIQKFEFIKALQAENASLHPPGVRPVSIASSESLGALFGKSGERADFDQFRSWIQLRADATVLSKWILLEPRVRLTSDLETPTFYQTLAGVTHLEERDISALEKCFWYLQSRSPTGQLDLPVLSPLLSPPVPRQALQGLFLALDENRDGHVDFKELCCGLSAACRGPSCERMKFCFKVFDTDRDGFLNESEVHQMCNILCSVAAESLHNHGGQSAFRRPSAQEVPLHPESIFDQLRKMSFADKNEIPRRRSREKSKRSSSERLFHLGDKLKTDLNEDVKNSLAISSFIDSESTANQIKIDINTLNVNSLDGGEESSCSLIAEEKKESLESGDDKARVEKEEDEWGLSQEEFLIWGVEKAENLVAPFLLLIYDVCHIVLGLRPQCKHQEHEIVLRWLSREVARGYSVGQFWYLVSSEWWQAWHAHSGGGGRGACSACGRRAPPARTPPIDEAIVCDESFNSTESMGDLLVRAETVSLGSGSSSSGVSSSSGSRSTRHPGPIDNSHLLQPSPFKVRSLTGEGGHLRRDLMLAQHRDFELVPDSLWKALAQWYGGPQPLPRQVIQPPNSDVELELYPRNLRLLRHTPPGQQTTPAQSSSWSGMVGGYGAAALSSVGMASYQSTTPVAQPVRYLAYTAAFSRLATIRQVCDFICCQLGLAREEVRLWLVLVRGGAGELLEEEAITLAQLGAEDGQRLLVEVRNKDLTWPEELQALSLSASAEGRSSVVSGATGGVASSPHPAGATGLHNLGNTCFMNAALQAVWNTGPLTRYFTCGMHLYELNTDNPHGTGGALAQRYGELCKEVWLSGARSVAPLRVRWCVWHHADRFSGGGQHDSQELLAWLLDALHEDLNRSPRGLPYRELGDSNCRPDQEVAQEAWDHHTASNQSIITELFYGQLKSKVTCASCGHESVRFDAFNMLSLPLPMESYIVVEVLVILLDGSVPIKYGVRLNSDARNWQLKQELSALCGQPARQLLLVPRLAGSAWPPRLPLDSARVTPHAPLCAYHVPGPAVTRQHTQVSDGDKEVGAPAAERSSISSDYSESPVANNFLNSKNIKSLESNNGSSGYNSIQELEANRQNDSFTPPNSIPSDYYNNASPKKTADQTKLPNEDLKAVPHKDSPTPSLKSIENSPNLMKKQLDSVNSTPIKGNEILLQPMQTNARVLRTNNNSPLLTSRKNTSMQASDKNLNLSNSPTLSTRKLSLENGKDVYNPGLRVDEDVSSLSSMKCDEEFVPNYLIAVHRKQSRQESYFLSQQKRRWETFGSPLVIPISEGCGGRELYAAVWRQVERLLSAPPPQPPDQANHATDCDDSLGYSFPFTLRAVGQRGLRCAVCPWTRFCRGCALPCTDDPLIVNLYPCATPPPHRYSLPSELTDSTEGREPVLSVLDMEDLRAAGQAEELHLAVDWEPTALHLRYQANRDAMFTEHESLRECRSGQAAPVLLQHCLRSFTSEERLEERYSCSACRSHQPATKKLQIWRLPPVLVIHLKRFQYVNKKWIKSHKSVNFPYEDFDPTAFLASVPQETILRHNDILLHRANKLAKRTPKLLSEESAEESDSEQLNDKKTVDSPVKMNSLSRENSDLDRSKINSSVLEDLKEEEENSNVSDEALRNSILEKIKNDPRKGSIVVSMRERLASTSLSKTPVLDDEFEDFHQHKLKPGEDPLNLKYRLYAVVSHSGMMNGGHYVAYAHNPSGAWYCYNDSSCRELTSPSAVPCAAPPIDPSSAYMLFYERTGLDYEHYLPDTEGKLPAVSELELAEGEDSDLKKMCTLS